MRDADVPATRATRSRSDDLLLSVAVVTNSRSPIDARAAQGPDRRPLGDHRHERAKRPHDFKGEAQSQPDGGPLPVLRGAARTRRRPRSSPTATAAPRPNEPGWRVRVVPNKFPALQIEGDLNKRGDGIYDKMNGIGAHEVIIECPLHDISMANALRGQHPRGPLGLPRPAGRPEEGPAAGPRHALQERRRRGRGVARAHAHQLIVTPIVPIYVWEEMTGSLEFFNYRGRCIYCDMIQQELATEKRIVLDTPNFIALLPRSPAGSRSRPGSCPSTTPATTRTSRRPRSTSWARVLKTILLKLETALDQPAVQLHHPHGAVRHAGAAALPLAHRDHPPPDARSPASSGAPVLHQPRPARGRRRSSCAKSRSTRPPAPGRSAMRHAGQTS